MFYVMFMLYFHFLPVFLFKYISYFILFVFSPKTLKYKISLVLSQATVTNSTTVNGANILSRTGGFYNEPFQGVKYKGEGIVNKLIFASINILHHKGQRLR